MHSLHTVGQSRRERTAATEGTSTDGLSIHVETNPPTQGPFSPSIAVSEFKKQFKAKAATDWEKRHGMIAKKGKYTWIGTSMRVFIHVAGYMADITALYIERSFEDDDKEDDKGTSSKDKGKEKEKEERK